jgi:hypothetical protein
VTLRPGIHDALPASDYHADPCETPSLSASIARILIGKSPAHAKAAHPRLNLDLVREESDKFDVGTCAHELLLRGVSVIDIIDAKDWRTADAKAARLASRNLGRIPLLPPQAEAVLAMVDAARIQIAEHSARPPLFANGKPEQTLIWKDDHDVVCRARLDWLRDDYEAIDDLKSTSASADPAKWTRTMYGMGADIQVAFYRRGVERLTGLRPAFRYAVIETYPPYAMSVVDLAPSALAIAEDKVERAIELWAYCVEKDFWPGYTDQVASIEVPTWEEMRWLDRQHEEAA